MIVRDARASDAPAIRAVETAAFGRPDEAALVDALVADGDAALSLVAEDGGVIIGHVLLSPMSAPFPALGLAPLAVAPDRQGEGIGSALVRAAIERARSHGAAAIFLLGDAGYYGRFGFDAGAASGFDTPYAGEHFQVLALGGELPARSGRVDYAPAFAALG